MVEERCVSLPPTIKNRKIICIRYAQNRKIGQTNNLVLGAIKPKGINRLSKIY
jgi:hypothetical protein